MKNFNKIAIAVALLSSGTAATVMAQTVDYNPSWYVAPSINAMDSDDHFGTGEARGPGVGIRLGKPLSEYWDIQMGTTYSRVRHSPVRYQQNTLGADGLFMFSRGVFRPFLLIGAGAERDKLNGGVFGKAQKTSPYINAGLGAQMLLNDQWAVQADLRRIRGFMRNSNDFGFKRSDNNYLTVGLNYSFDKPAAPAPAITPMPEPTPIAKPEPAPAPPPPPPAPRFEKYTLSSTELFAFNSAKLNMPQPKLDEIATALKNDPSIGNVTITGYADRIGSSKYNLKLSEKRANSVRDYLTSQGIAASRLTAVGKGKANPVVVCTDKKRPALIKCLEPNRRVEIEQITIERRVQ